MVDEIITAKDKLKQIREELYQGWTHLQVIGRALTPEEELKSKAFNKAVQLIDKALNVLDYDKKP